MSDSSDVLTRLDSLVANHGGTHQSGILKSKGKGSSKNKRIRFPETIQEVIGYGGLYEEDEDEDNGCVESVKKGRISSDNSDDEEDKEFSTLTRKNTNFNSHLQNLNGDGKPPALLGSSKTKNPPLITVRPFSHRETSSTLLTINKVAPMINGQLVKKNLGSDGDEEETDSEDPHEDEEEDEEEEDVKPKVSSARLSFLNGTISFEPSSSREIPINSSSSNVKEEKKVEASSAPPRFITTSVIKNVHIKTSISRKPPILKEKPLVKITSRALLERRKSSEDEEDEGDDIDDDVISSSSSDICSYDVNKKDDGIEDHSDEVEEKDEEDSKDDSEEEKPIAAPRKLSISSMIPFNTSQISISSESKSQVPETENKVQSSIKLLSYTENLSNSFNSTINSGPQKAPPPIKLPLEAKSSFELNRASIAHALEFNRMDKAVRTSTKRKAPLAPSTQEIPIDIGEKPSLSESLKDVEEESIQNLALKPVIHVLPGVVPKPPPLPPVNLFKNISLAITPSDIPMTSAINKRVNNIEAIQKESTQNIDPNYIESSFTAGKPIKTVPPPEPVAFLVKDEDEVRKWKEKKQPYPPSPEISGEILGSSKKSQQNFLTAAASMVMNKAEQQIGAAIDESVKLKKLSEKKFSFKKFFHGSSATLKKLSSDSDTSSTSSSEKSCLDKEHEREILEREKKLIGKGILRKVRPEIIHPCTFSIDDDAAPATKIEVVKIIPGETTSRSVSKQPITRSLSSDPQLCLKDQSLSVLKNTETASISSASTTDTECSNKSEITISSASTSYGSETESSSSVSTSGSKNKLKPAPPPRRHSLENFVEPNPLRNSRHGLDKVQEELSATEPIKKSDEDFRNSLLIIPQDESENIMPSYMDKNYKAMIEMNNEALRILFEKVTMRFNAYPFPHKNVLPHFQFSRNSPDMDLASKLNEADLSLSDFDVSKSSRLTTRIGSFYEATWEGYPFTLLLSHVTDLTQKNRIPSLPTPLLSFREDDVPSTFTVVANSKSDEQVVIYVYPPFKLESLESFSSHIDNSNSSHSAKKFFILQLLTSLELNPRETDPLCYFMAKRISDSGLFSYKLISLFIEAVPESSTTLFDILHSILSEFDIPEGSPPSILGKRKREIERQLFAEGSRLHLQKAEALTKLVSKSSPILSVVEEFQLKYLLSQEPDLSTSSSTLETHTNANNSEITYVYNV